MIDRVYWYEDNHENLRKVRELTELELEKIKSPVYSGAFDRRHLLYTVDRYQVVNEIANQFTEKYPISTQVFARVIDIVYQQAQVAVAPLYSYQQRSGLFGGGAAGRTTVHVERVEAAWKLLVRREDNGTAVEKKPSEVTYCVEKCERPVATSLPGSGDSP